VQPENQTTITEMELFQKSFETPTLFQEKATTVEKQ